MKKTDKFSYKSILKAVWIFYAFLSIIVTFCLIDKLLSKDYASISQYVSLDDSWDITINGASYQNIFLSDFTFNAVSMGDEITMRRALPSHLDYVEAALCLHIKQTAVKIFINNEQIYEYGYDRMAQNKTVGSGYLLINLPAKYEGQELKLQMTVAENNAFSQLDHLRIYEWENIYRAILTENRIPLFVGCFLTVFGLVTCIITAFALIYSTKYLKILCVSVFSICMGLWTLCYYNVILIFSLPLYSICLLEYLALYLAPIPLILYLREDVLMLKQKYMHTLYRILLVIQIAATSCMIGLHMVDLVHCAATLKYMQVLIVCNLIYAIIVETINLKTSRNLTHRLFLIGMLILSGCVVYDLLYYNIDRYLGLSILPVKGISSLGLVAFIFILFVTFYINMTQRIMQEAERSFLIQSAYTDELTQIHNRRYCIEYMNRIKSSEELNYTVFCFDLNNLKYVNDTFGHAKGDILIKSAAEVIAKTFGSHGIVARMGGDEFIAIAETSDASATAAMMNAFQQNIAHKNQEIPNLNMSIACGYASCSVKEYNIDKIYQLADDRMYENKKQMKQADR